MGETSRINSEGLKSVAALIDRGMKINKVYEYGNFWDMFVIPSSLKADELGISSDNANDRSNIKVGINQIFEADKSDKRLHVQHGDGFYLLDEATGVCQKKLQFRAQKIGSSIDTSCAELAALSEANGLGEDNMKTLKKFEVLYEGAKDNLIGMVMRMKRIPAEVKFPILKALGAEIEDKED